ncbi:uncharacterized protein LOC132385995 isoform X1 [Hypanus sabinus]|uniref:uncharacterized protein LOC132385995 isoform X1 n=1 Tax=Hypanus sabinus TaxID=79690 RepID=UPI0028C37C71|nr:uncharacterized protein LOC132385995 isoform X1 [Hypanus sabinus]XP_059814216.1 uncharacterized protein LOC132385995 isoform X1 [Hypanus sabinus]
MLDEWLITVNPEKEQSHSVQSHITSQFAELRQIITEKEQSLLRDLREEEKRILNPMEKNLLALQENIRSIQEEITKLKEQMDQKDGVIFLKEEARRNRRINDNVQELSVTDETLPVEKFDHIYLLNTVLRETLDAINRGKTYKDSFLLVYEDQFSSNLRQRLSVILGCRGTEVYSTSTPLTGRHHCHMVSWRCQTPGHTSTGSQYNQYMGLADEPLCSNPRRMH